MQIITYLGFTLLSIFIQFSVMDFIQGRLKNDENKLDLKEQTSPKRHFRDVLKDITFKPHALYYQTQKSKLHKHQNSATLLSNNSLTALLATTEIPTTLIDILYEDNITSTTIITTDETFTMESLYTSTEFENITEITFFEIKNETKSKPKTTTNKFIHKECKCNLLFSVCDINCCCDSDCTDIQIKLFPNCGEEQNTKIAESKGGDCHSALPYLGYGNGLFCIVKINLPPENHNMQTQSDLTPPSPLLSWKNVVKNTALYEYTNQFYKYGDPIWLLKNGTIYHIDLPTPLINNYCTARKSMQFLKDEEIKCHTNIRDLEMLQISKSLEDATIISATNHSMNSSFLNCTNLHCVNWTIIACNNTSCENYRKDIHEPTCDESVCTNLALKIVYTFYYYDSKIINASLHFHIKNVTMDLPLLQQVMQVKFIMANESVDQIIKLSGSPGYMDGLPIIASYVEKNHTETFFNTTKPMRRYLGLLANHKGLCISSNSSSNVILFGQNRRAKCRYYHIDVVRGNNPTNDCKTIQNDINILLAHNVKMFVSPLGNPNDLKDIDWIVIEKPLFNCSIYGIIQDNVKLHCFNLITRFSTIFNYANINGDNRILSCKYTKTPMNTTFSLDDLSTIITTDVSFVEVHKPTAIDQGRGPNLNIHLPKDFLYPFGSNESHSLQCNLFTIFYCTLIVITFK